jgi:hypothetical protein
MVLANAYTTKQPKENKFGFLKIFLKIYVKYLPQAMNKMLQYKNTAFFDFRMMILDTVTKEATTAITEFFLLTIKSESNRAS